MSNNIPATPPTAFITGAASGIGKATALLFARSGYLVGGADIVDFASEHENIVPVQLDVSNEENWREALSTFVARCGRIDALVNVAGILDTGSIADIAPDMFMRMMDVNTKSVFTGCREAIAIMAKSGTPASIVNIASANAVKAQSWTSAYAATKAAVVSLTRTTALHCAEHDYRIRVNAVLPGIVETPMVRKLIETSDDPVATRNHLESYHPIKRLIDPEEVAEVVLFLTSNSASAITGAAIAVDGGMTAG